MRSAMIGEIEVSVVGLGCNNLGRALDQPASTRVVGAALDAGMTYFDTASNYGNGQSERFLGRALGHRRDEVVISTKFGVPVPGWDGSGGASPGYARQALDRSLAELGTDYIDIWMLHRPDPETPMEDTLATMHGAVEDGLVRQIGCSNLDARQLDEALSISGSRELSRFCCDQVEYSLVHRDPETGGLQDVCFERGVALLPYYPLGSGLLTGKTRRGREPEGRLKMDRYQRFLSSENFDIAEGLEEFSRERGLTMAQVALGWLLAQPAVPCVTPGATSEAQVASNVAAGDWQPDAEDLAELESLGRG